MPDSVTDQRIDRTLFAWLLFAGLLGTALGVPWTIAILGNPGPALISAAVEFVLFLAPASAAAVWLGRRVRLGSDVRDLVTMGCRGGGIARRGTLPSLLVGAGVGLAGFFAQGALPKGALVAGLEIPNSLEWLLRCLSAALTEEIFFRAGLMTLIVWSLGLLVKRPSARVLSLWIGNLLSALVFAGAHLTQLTPGGWSFLVPVLAFSSGAGMVMGWLYMRYGLIAAVIAHFTGDFLVYVVPRWAGLHP